MATIRPARLEDAQALVDLYRQLDAETNFLLFEPGERTTSVDAQRRQLAEMGTRANQRIFVADDSAGLIGFAAALGGMVRRNHHKAHLVIGVLDAYQGQGVGTSLLVAIDGWAKGAGLTRLQLTVMVHNARALALYEKLGFVIEGRAHRSLLVDGAYVDELFMAKVL